MKASNHPSAHVTVRTATARDARYMHALGLQSFGFEWATFFAGVTDLAARIFHSDSNGWVFHVAQAGADVVGVSVVKPCGTDSGEELAEGVWAELLFLAVGAPVRGQGVGTALHDASMGGAKATGRLGVMASVTQDLLPWYTARTWRAGSHGESIWYADLRTLPRGRLSWGTPADDRHPHWVWRGVDEAQPVRAWLLPAGATPAAADVKAEVARQVEYLVPQDSAGPAPR